MRDSQSQVKSMSVSAFQALSLANPSLQIIDVREAPEYEAEYIFGSVLAPLSIFEESHKRIDPSKHVYLLCKSGARAKQYGEKLQTKGHENYTIIEGGITAWQGAGYPIEKGQSHVWSLERQVRVAAGSLVLTGVILSLFLNPGFIALSGFVGAGLIFAGVTDTCGMGMLLAKMPWNQEGACSARKE